MYKANITICLSLLNYIYSEARLYHMRICAHYAVKDNSDSIINNYHFFLAEYEIWQEHTLIAIRSSFRVKAYELLVPLGGTASLFDVLANWIQCSPMLRPRRICCSSSSTQRSRFAHRGLIMRVGLNHCSRCL